MIKQIKKFNVILLFLIFILIIMSLLFRLNLNKIFLDINLYQKIFTIRLERILEGLIFGGVLAISGLVFQKIFSNPLVEPFTLGISGISFLSGNIFTFIIKNSFVSTGFGIVAGIIFNIIFIYYLFTKRFHLYKILIIGIMINMLSVSLVEILYYIFHFDNILVSKSLLVGNFSININILLYIFILFAVFCLFLFYKLGDTLDVMSLGEENAIYLGVDVLKERKKIFLLTSVMIGISVFYIGLVGFVGLIIPHIIRNIFGDRTKDIFIPVMLLGIVYLLLADFVAKNIVYPIEIPLGIITNILGGIFLLFLLLKRKTYE